MHQRILDAESRAARAEAKAEAIVAQSDKMEGYWREQFDQSERLWKMQGENAERTAKAQAERSSQVWKDHAETVERDAQAWAKRLTSEQLQAVEEAVAATKACAAEARAAAQSASNVGGAGATCTPSNGKEEESLLTFCQQFESRFSQQFELRIAQIEKLQGQLSAPVGEGSTRSPSGGNDEVSSCSIVEERLAALCSNVELRLTGCIDRAAALHEEMRLVQAQRDTAPCPAPSPAQEMQHVTSAEQIWKQHAERVASDATAWFERIAAEQKRAAVAAISAAEVPTPRAVDKVCAPPSENAQGPESSCEGDNTEANSVNLKLLACCQQLQSQFALVEQALAQQGNDSAALLQQVDQALAQQRNDSAALLQQQREFEQRLTPSHVADKSGATLLIPPYDAESSPAPRSDAANDALQNLAKLCQQLESRFLILEHLKEAATKQHDDAAVLLRRQDELAASLAECKVLVAAPSKQTGPPSLPPGPLLAESACRPRSPQQSDIKSQSVESLVVNFEERLEGLCGLMVAGLLQLKSQHTADVHQFSELVQQARALPCPTSGAAAGLASSAAPSVSCEAGM
jgi:hypothetical protein